MSGRAYRWAIKQDLKLASKSVLLAIAWYADEAGKNSHPGAPLLSRHTGMTIRSVRRALSDLESAGLIRRDGFSRKGDRVEFSRSAVYSLPINESDTVSPSDSVEHDTVSPSLMSVEHDRESPSKVERDTASLSEGVERDNVSPYYNNNQHSIDSVLSERASLNISEAVEQWRICSNQNGVVPRQTDQNAILGFVKQYTLKEVLDAISAIAEDEHPRPRVFWIRDRIEQRRKRKEKRKQQQQQQRSRSGIDIESAWSKVTPESLNGESIASRLKTRGTR